MRNTVAKAIRNRVYGTFGHTGRDYQAKTFDKLIWAMFKEGDHVRTERYYKPLNTGDKDVHEIAEDLIPSFTVLIRAWNPIQIRDLGVRAIYKLAKRYYKQGQYEEMEKLFK
jgi:hypothetical protein